MLARMRKNHLPSFQDFLKAKFIKHCAVILFSFLNELTTQNKLKVDFVFRVLLSLNSKFPCGNLFVQEDKDV